ncbi:MAG: glycosyltransferase family 4 protein [Candidatus Buchananbacteria bacterium]
MKILYFSNSRIPTEKAHGVQIIKMCEGFALSGEANEQSVEVELILPTRKNQPFFGQDAYDYYQVRKNFKLVKIFSCDPVFLLKFISGLYIKVQLSFFICSLFLYLLFIKKDKETIFYTRDEYLLPLLQFFSNKVVWEAHNLPRNKRYYQKYWRRCFKIIAISKGLEDELVTLGLSGSLIVVAPDAVDLKEFSRILDQADEVKKAYGLAFNKKIILYSGHLYEWKGARILAQAAQYLLDNCLVVFVGGTTEEVGKFRKEFSGSKNIIFLGHQPFSQIPRILQAADVLVLPNSAKSKISSQYTSPLKLFEYMATGRPIVASALPSIKEILNQDNSVLFEPDNAQALAEAIIKVLKDEAFSARIAKQSWLDVQGFSWTNRAKKIIATIS